MSGLLHLVQQGGAWAGPQPGRVAAPPRPLLAVPNVTAHPSMASVLTSYYSMWHYNCVWSLDSRGLSLLIVCLSLVYVCSGRISSKTAEQIWLKFGTGTEVCPVPCTASHILVAVARPRGHARGADRPRGPARGAENIPYIG